LREKKDREWVRKKRGEKASGNKGESYYGKHILRGISNQETTNKSSTRGYLATRERGGKVRV